jgi:hypothetical protein
MKTSLASLFAASLAFTTTARAETAELKSERTATAATVAGTLAPIAMMVAASQVDDAAAGPLALAGAAGLVLAPSAGHWYSGEIMTRGLVLRLAGVMVATSALIMAFDDDCLLYCPGAAPRPIISHSDPEGDNGMMAGLALVGAGLFVAGVVHDIATADDAAREYNRTHTRRLTGVELERRCSHAPATRSA